MEKRRAILDTIHKVKIGIGSMKNVKFSAALRPMLLHSNYFRSRIADRMLRAVNVMKFPQSSITSEKLAVYLKILVVFTRMNVLVLHMTKSTNNLS